MKETKAERLSNLQITYPNLLNAFFEGRKNYKMTLLNKGSRNVETKNKGFSSWYFRSLSPGASDRYLQVILALD